MNEEVKEQPQGEFTPVFAYENTGAKIKALRDLKFQFEKAQQFIPLIEEANLQVTQEIVLDCLTITKKETWTHATDRDGNASIYGTMSYKYEHCEHIDGEFAKQVQLLTANKPKMLADKIKAEIEDSATKFKDSVFRVFKELGSDSKEDTDLLQRYVVVFRGEITLPEDIEERVTHDTGVWCNTEAQAQVFEAHKHAADAIRAFLAMFPKQYLPRSTAELGNLFKFGENGEIEPQMVDYSLYI